MEQKTNGKFSVNNFSFSGLSIMILQFAEQIGESRSVAKRDSNDTLAPTQSYFSQFSVFPKRPMKNPVRDGNELDARGKHNFACAVVHKLLHKVLFLRKLHWKRKS